MKKLTTEKIKKIKTLKKEKISVSLIAKKLKVSEATVRYHLKSKAEKEEQRARKLAYYHSHK